MFLASKKNTRHGLILVVLCALTCFGAQSARADCADPHSVTAQIIYNTTHNVFQGCRADGQWVSLWAAMESGGGAAAPLPLATILATGNDAGNAKITNLGAPTLGTDGAHKNYVDGKFGTLTNNRWCTSNGTQVLCTQNAPTAPATPNLSSVLAVGNDAGNAKITGLGGPTVGTDAAHKNYVDGKFGTLTNGRWCTSNGTQVLCTQTAPAAPATPNLSSVLSAGNDAGNAKITGLAAPTVGTDAAHKTYVDGKFGTLTNSRWCTSNGTQVLCTQNAPVLSESDPKVAATTNNKWCRGTGTTVTCDQDAPAADGNTLAGLSCTTGQISVKTAGGWGCIDLPEAPVIPEYNYLVMTKDEFNGNLGGLSGANDKCLSDLQANNWRGKDLANLSSSTVKAFLCTTSSCNDLKAEKTYIFALSGSTIAGGATITTDSNGRGPGNSILWESSPHFYDEITFWANRGTVNNSTWSNAPSQTASNNTCTNWTSALSSRTGRIGNTENSDSTRWDSLGDTCNRGHHLICIVESNP